MPILPPQQNASLTQDSSRSLALFCDRLDARALFARQLNARRTPERILWFHGDGGNGKSLLLNKLAQDYCRFLPDAHRWPDVMVAERWSALDAAASQRALSALDAALAGAEAEPVALTSIDFGGPGRWLQDMRQPVAALNELRRQLVAQGFRFPLFDYGLILWLHHEGRLDKTSLQQFFESASLDVAAQVLEVLSDVPLVSAVPKLFKLVAGAALGRRVELDIAQAMARWKLGPDELASLARLHGSSELPLHLPRLLARDLNAAMAVDDRPAPRLVLMFDTHEAFWGRDAAGDSQAAWHARDEWLRTLLGQLDLTAGIVAVVAGRDAPRWADAPPGSAIPSAYLQTHLVGGLDSPDADDYLQQAGVEDASMRQALLDVAAVAGAVDRAEAGGRQHHPFYLGLAAETWFAMRARGVQFDAAEFAGQRFDDAPDRNGKGRLLLDRFLKHSDDRIEDAVHVLAAARRFDWPLYRHLADAIGLPSDRASFERLVRLSFVRRDAAAATGAGTEVAAVVRYSIHDLARRILRARRAPRLLEADAVLQLHYQARALAGDELASVEAIYHQWSGDPVAAEQAWIDAMAQGTDCGRQALCQALGALLDEVSLSSPLRGAEARGMVGRSWRRLSRHALAEAALLQALKEGEAALLRPGTDPVEVPAVLAAIQVELAECCADQSLHVQARQWHTAAVANCRRVHALSPQHLGAWSSLASAQMGMAGLASMLAEHDEAQRWFEAAIDSSHQALRQGAQELPVWNNLGIAQIGLAKLLTGLSRHSEAQRHFDDAIASYQHVLDRAPDDVAAWANLAVAQDGLAQLLAAQGQSPPAQRLLETSISSYHRVLALAPDHALAWNNLGSAQTTQAQLQAALSQHDEGLAGQDAAIASYRRALELAPEQILTWCNLGTARLFQAMALSGLSRYAEAQAHIDEAIAGYRRALELAPRHTLVWTNLASAQHQLADLHERQWQHALARSSYDDAIASTHELLALAPDSVYAWLNLAQAQLGQAGLLASLSQHMPALQRYEETIASCRRVLAMAPDQLAAWCGLGSAQLGLARLRGTLSHQVEARQAVDDAIASYRHALALAPDQGRALDGLANGQQVLAENLLAQAQLPQARQSYEDAIATDQALLELTPDNAAAWRHLGAVQRGLAELLVRMAQHPEAQHQFTMAIDSFGRALALAPAYTQVWNSQGVAQHSLGNLHAQLGRREQAQRCLGEAISSLERALALAPDFGLASNNLGKAQLSLARVLADLARPQESQGVLLAAATACARARSLAPDSAVVLHAQVDIALQRIRQVSGLGRITRRQTLVDEARGHLDIWRAVAPADPMLAAMEAQWAELRNRQPATPLT